MAEDTERRRAAAHGLDQSISLNANLLGLECLRCGAAFGVGDFFSGCPHCLASGYPSSVRHMYAADRWRAVDSDARPMPRYAACLGYSSFISLGEGGTPLVPCEALARELGVAEILAKDEGENPTGSHKDRMSALAITRAADLGVQAVVAASSGNAGVSIAAYAARAGLKAVIVTTPDVKQAWRQAMIAAGAELMIVKEPLERWTRIGDLVREQNCFPVTNFTFPPVGSNHFGVDGLKTIAFELQEQTPPDSIDAVVVPTSRGDLLWGVFEGFRYMMEAGAVLRIPRLFAVEPFPRLEMALLDHDHRRHYEGRTEQVSIGGSTVTFQAMIAVSRTFGAAVSVSDAVAASAQADLARHGINAELSSAASLGGLRLLIERGDINPADRIVLIISSRG